MGETAENVARKYGITRAEQDKVGAESNDRAIKAVQDGVFKEQIVPLKTVLYDEKGGKKEFVFDTDEGPRGGTTAEGLSKLKPAFWKTGTVTAGNSSQMSDGAAAVVVMDRSIAEKKGIKPWAKLHGYVVVGFEPELMGIGPAFAIPRLMEKFGKPLGLTDLHQIDCIELNEAFASQAVMCIKHLGIQDMWDEGRINPTGGAIALGHPLGCTGAKLSTQLLHWLKDHKKRWGIVSMCIGGGMGAAGLFENYLV
jgi:acetyl-CoA acyltransferase